MKNKFVVIDKPGFYKYSDFNNDETEIFLNEGTVVIEAFGNGRSRDIYISPEDFEKVDSIETSWYVKVSKGTAYAYFCENKNGNRSICSMHRYIMETPDNLVVDHHPNHFGLDNRRENLTNVTWEENASNQVRTGLKYSKYRL